MILYIDTETSGYWLDDLDPADPRQPVVVQVAAVLENDAGRIVAALATILTLGGWDRERQPRMEDRVVEKHGITEQMCFALGVGPVIALEHVRRLLMHATRIVAHNSGFDVRALTGSYAAAGLPCPVFPDPYCTQEGSTPIVRLPATEAMVRTGRGPYKSPKLAEAYYHFTRRTFSGAHDALYDTMACRMVYKGIQRHLREAAEPLSPGPGSGVD